MDTLYYNGKIYSMDQKDRQYTAIGICDGQIGFLGNDVEARAVAAENTVDLNGACVLPGFIDAHLHLLNYAFVEDSYKMFGVDSIHRVVEEGKHRMADLDGSDEKQWLYGRGWNDQNFSDEKRLLTRYDLDQISTARPILFIRVCGHAAVVNSKGLEIIMNLPQTTDYAEQIDFKNGILTEAAVKLCYHTMDPPSVEKIKEMILYAQKKLNQCGITSIESDNFLSLPGRDSRRILRAHRQLDEEKRLTVRMREQASFTSFEDMKTFIDDGHRTGQGSDFYSIGPIKLYQDGSLGAKTALLHAPYINQKNHCGLMVHMAEDLQRCIHYAYQHDMQVLVHSIGDKSSDMVCTAYEEAIEAHGPRDHRLAINHLQIVSPDLLDRMKRHDILAYIQPAFVASDKAIIRDLIGEEREKSSYCWNTMLKKGIRCCGSSDAPVENFDVLSGIQIAVTRDRLDEHTNGWYPDEKLTVKEAVKLFTIHSAYSSFSEHRKGSLELGKLADLVVLGEDIFEVDAHRIADIPIYRTIVGGKEVWRHGAVI